MSLEEILSYNGKRVRVIFTDGHIVIGKVDGILEDFDEECTRDGFFLDADDGNLYGYLPEKVEKIELIEKR